MRFPRPRVCLLRMLAPLLDDLTGLPLTQGRVRVARGDVIEARPKPVEVEPQREVVAHVREPIIQQRGLPSAGGAASRRQARAGGGRWHGASARTPTAVSHVSVKATSTCEEKSE